MWHFLEIRAHMRNFPEKRWRIRVQKGLQNNENASIFIKDLFAHLSRLDFRVQNEICKFKSALAMVKILLFSPFFCFCVTEAIFYAMAEALGNQNLCQWAWTGTNWDSRSGQKKKNHQGFNIKEFFWFLLCSTYFSCYCLVTSRSRLQWKIDA